MKKIFSEDLNFVGKTKHQPNPPKYSSVMDYMDFHNPILFVPGKLDIAALRFIYFDKVDLKNGVVLKVPSGADTNPHKPQKSILKAAEAKNYSRENLKNYKILCGGDKIETKDYLETNPNQPLCKRFDYGSSPLEIVINSILKTNNYILMNGRNRYDSDSVLFRSERHFYYLNERLKSLYNKWKQYRDELLSQKRQSIEDYSFLNPKHISQYDDLMPRGINQ